MLAAVCKWLGIAKTRTTALQPQSDGLVEHFNHILTTQLAILTSQHQRDWDRHLPQVLWAYRSAVQESSVFSSSTLMFGCKLWTTVDLVFGAPPGAEEPTHSEYYCQLVEWLKVVHDFVMQAQDTMSLFQKQGYDQRCRGLAFNM